MKNSDLYINPNGNKRKSGDSLLIDILLIIAIIGGLITCLFFA